MGLQVVENWNSANQDLFYGKDGDLTGADKESQEASVLALHLLQSSLDRTALSPLFWTHVNPYGRFELDMNRPLDLGPVLPPQREPHPPGRPLPVKAAMA